MELESNFQLQTNLDFQLDLQPECLEDQASLCQSPSQLTAFLLSNSNPLSENNSGLFSTSTNEEKNESLDNDFEINESAYSAYCSIGGKRKMQDKITIHIDEPTQSQFFGIYDGFGDSSKISTYLSEELHSQLFEPSYPQNLLSLINQTINSLHFQITSQFKSDIKKSGSTALFALKTPDNLIIVNLGDSRAVLYEFNKQSCSYKQLSTDHSASSNQDELDRIESLGGFIFDMRGIKRVQGELAVTRAFTNNPDLAKYVAIEPQITVIPLKELKSDSKYQLVLASDGLWNELSNQELLNFLSEKIVSINEEENISKEIYNYCLKKNTYIRDNVSIISFNLSI